MELPEGPPSSFFNHNNLIFQFCFLPHKYPGLYWKGTTFYHPLCDDDEGRVKERKKKRKRTTPGKKSVAETSFSRAASINLAEKKKIREISHESEKKNYILTCVLLFVSLAFFSLWEMYSAFVSRFSSPFLRLFQHLFNFSIPFDVAFPTTPFLTSPAESLFRF